MSVRKQILELFRLNRGSYLSGEDISRELGCSRTAVWKHIEGLRQEGYRFDAVTRKGYCLIEEPERIEEKAIEEALQTSFMGKNIVLLDEVESTMNEAHRLVAEGANEGTLVIAEEQTSGRGRMGKKWHSPKGKGIWMSLILKPRVPVYFVPQLTLLTAVALCRAVRRETGIDIGIKWPNDLLVRGKKVSGILLEMSGEDERLKYVIVGTGITANLTEEDIPEELTAVATSLAIEAGTPVKRETLIAAFLNELETLYQLYMENGFAPIRTMWEAMSVTLHNQVRVKTAQGVIEGRAESLDESGALVVRQLDGEKVRVYSGDVDIR
ncbi:biotin--[acetyl-CoA-carboxylase] ligase [Paenibacillus lutrae]|uniref:Bifunctional ligase/repressor BirA n=1 Tax=Paenibacillus lutrae TaxID=2078573 RepID=A0A7X3JZG2_9BACL|nr:biotin--[acetyl-CoA-carboxylase] ligase [Paenibacillus lutrae]MVP00007.1 biotin--[acetyl-CoA-carboxylase] ligase [Paenibacillus lutrae]